METKNCSGLTKDDWADLIDEIKSKNCILVLGPETSIMVVEGKEKGTSEVLSMELANELTIMKDEVKLEDLVWTTQAYNYEYKNLRRLRRKVKDFFEENKDKPNPVYDILANLPFVMIVNATPDRRIIDALEVNDKEPIETYYNYLGSSDQDIDWEYDENNVKKPLIFYLYGSTNESNSLVLTENDLLKFLVAIIKKSPELPGNITSVFKDKRKSFLFLGFGFKNWYLRILLYVLLRDEDELIREGLSFALEDFSPLPEDKFTFTSLFFRKEHNIFICKMDLKKFITELGNKYKADPEPVEVKFEPKTKKSAQKQPTIFLCHSNEDKDFAVQLYKNLQKKGLKPWLDKKNIYGGDQWGPLIEETIQEVDYFCILHSDSLVKKYEGYVNREIFYAQQRQLKFGRGVRFIITIKIDDSHTLKDLQNLHYVEIKNSADVGELVNTIKIDQKLRHSYEQSRS